MESQTDKVSLWGGYPPVPNQTDFPRLRSDSWKAELIYDSPNTSQVSLRHSWRDGANDAVVLSVYVLPFTKQKSWLCRPATSDLKANGFSSSTLRARLLYPLRERPYPQSNTAGKTESEATSKSNSGRNGGGVL